MGAPRPGDFPLGSMESRNVRYRTVFRIAKNDSRGSEFLEGDLC